MDTGSVLKSDPEKSFKTGMQAMQFSHYFLLIILIIVMVIFFRMIKFFMVPIIVAGVFCTLFYPLHEKLLIWTKGRNGVSAFLACITLLLGLLIPLALLVNVVINQALDLYDSVVPTLEKLYASPKINPDLLKEYPWFQRLQLDKVDWRATIQEGLKTITGYMGKLINLTSRGTVLVVTNLLITVFTMFYFFKDGTRIVSTLMGYLPLGDEHKALIIKHFNSISRATVKGTIILGCLQGVLGGLTLWAFGFKAVVMWGMVMVVLSLLPVVGAFLVLIPAAIFEFATGSVGNGLGILLISIIVISNVDNLIRPRLVGRDAGMHDLMVFFSSLGGIAFFGIMGFIIGPVLASLLITLLDIYSLEFKRMISIQKEETLDVPPLPPLSSQ